MSDPELKQLLTDTRTVAIVGHSDKPWRDSYRIGLYLRAEGYQVYPVNPHISEVLGLPCFPDLAALPVPIDLVNVFRANAFVGQVVADAIAVRAKALWTQLGVYVSAADKQLLEQAGISLVESQCIKVDHRRLFADFAAS